MEDEFMNPITERIQEHLPFTRSVARRFYRLNHPPVDPDWIIGSAEWGLVQASHSYDPEAGVKFRTYAYPRIYGQIQDDLRSEDYLSRQLRNRVNQARRLIESRMQAGESMPDQEQLQSLMSLNAEQVSDLMPHLYETPRPLHDSHSVDRPDLSAILDCQLLTDQVFSCLSTADQELVRLKYLEGLELTEIAELTGQDIRAVTVRHQAIMQGLRDEFQCHPGQEVMGE